MLTDTFFTSPLQLQQPSSPSSPFSHSCGSVSIPKPCLVLGEVFPGGF